MNKIIKNEQIQVIIKILQKYNIGVQEYSALVEMLNGLPEHKVEPVAVDLEKLNEEINEENN